MRIAIEISTFCATDSGAMIYFIYLFIFRSKPSLLFTEDWLEKMSPSNSASLTSKWKKYSGLWLIVSISFSIKVWGVFGLHLKLPEYNDEYPVHGDGPAFLCNP